MFLATYAAIAFNFPLLLYCGILFVLFLGCVFYHRTTITIRPSINNEKLVIQKNRKEIALDLPIVAEVWWNYSFKSSLMGVGHGSMPGKPTSNDINVILEIEDKNGQKLSFTEKIIFGQRFPNEADYSIEQPDDLEPVLKVQRVDKLFEFLRPHIVKRF